MESKIPLTVRLPLTGNLESRVWSTEFTDWNPESNTGLEGAVYMNCILESSPLYTPKQCSSQSFEQLIYFICHNDISLCAFCVVKVNSNVNPHKNSWFIFIIIVVIFNIIVILITSHGISEALLILWLQHLLEFFCFSNLRFLKMENLENLVPQL